MKKMINPAILVLICFLPIAHFLFKKVDIAGTLFFYLAVIGLPLAIMRLKFFLVGVDAIASKKALLVAIGLLTDLLYLVFIASDLLLNFKSYQAVKFSNLPVVLYVLGILYIYPNIIASISFLKHTEEYQSFVGQLKGAIGFPMLYVVGIFFGNLIKNLGFLHIGYLVLSRFPERQKSFQNMKIGNMITGIRSQMAINSSQEKEIRKIILSQMSLTKLSDYNSIYMNMFSPNLDFLIMRKLNRILESRAKQQMFRMQRGGGGRRGMRIIRR